MARREKVKGRAGAFWGGTFIGFLLTLALLAGIGCLIYFKASAKLINKTFKTDINLGSDELNNKTISDLVADISGIVKNKDTYSLSDLEKDFGISLGNNLMGIKIDDLKSVGLTKLGDAVEKKFGEISAQELRSVSSLKLEEEMGHILKQTSTYYYKSEDNKLYEKLEGTTYSKAVAFDYKIIEENGDKKVVTKGHKTTIEDNIVQIQLWYLPLTSALGDFTANMGTNLTLKVLERDFGIKLPSFFDNVDKDNTTINQLESAINTLYIADFLGYSVDDTNPNNLIVKDKSNAVVTGLMASLATIKIDDLDNGAIEEKIGSMTAEELRDIENLNLEGNMGTILNKTNTYYVRSSNSKLYKSYNGTSYDDLADFDYTADVTPNATKITIKGNTFNVVDGKIVVPLWKLPLANAIGDFTEKMGENLTLKDLEDSFGVVLPDFFKNIDKANTTINGLETAINNLQIADFLGYTVTGATVKDGEGYEVDGFMKTIALQKISEIGEGGLETTINNMQIAELLGLIIVDEGGVDVVYDGANKVEGVLATVAKLKVNELKEGVKSLKLTDVFASDDFESGVLSLIDHPENLSIDNIPNAIQNAVTNKSIAALFTAEVLNADDFSTAELLVLKTKVDHDNNALTDPIALEELPLVECMKGLMKLALA